DRVHEFVLLPVVLVEEQVQLVERVPGHLPVVLLVEVAQDHRVRQNLVEGGHAGGANLLVQGQRHPRQGAVRLDFLAALPVQRLRRTGAVAVPPARRGGGRLRRGLAHAVFLLFGLDRIGRFALSFIVCKRWCPCVGGQVVPE